MTNDTERKGWEFVGGTRDTPPPAKPGDTWWPPDGPPLRMGEDGEWVSDLSRMIAMYGVCTVCGAPRTKGVWEKDLSPMGQLTVQYAMFCSVDREHTQDAP